MWSWSAESAFWGWAAPCATGRSAHHVHGGGNGPPDPVLPRETEPGGGFDILLTHSPIAGLGDQTDLPHRGFECFKPLLSQYRPRVMFHGHVHQAYSGALGFTREREWEGIPVINACGSYAYDWPDEWQIDRPPRRWALRKLKKRSQPGGGV